jgi:hypothetical protein
MTKEERVARAKKAAQSVAAMNLEQRSACAKKAVMA